MDLILPIYDVFRPDVDQLDFLESKEIERHLNVLQHVESHFAFLAGLKRNETLIEQLGNGIKQCDLPNALLRAPQAVTANCDHRVSPQTDRRLGVKPK